MTPQTCKCGEAGAGPITEACGACMANAPAGRVRLAESFRDGLGQRRATEIVDVGRALIAWGRHRLEARGNVNADPSRSTVERLGGATLVVMRDARGDEVGRFRLRLVPDDRSADVGATNGGAP